MDQEQSIFWYFQYLFRESLHRLFRELLGWRGLVLLAALGYELVMVLPDAQDAADGGFLASVPVFSLTLVWILAFFPFRMGKLFYLLPISKKGRRKYVLAVFLKYVVYSFLYLAILGLLMRLLFAVPVSLYLILVFTRSVPLAIIMSSAGMNAMVTKNQCFSTRGWWYQESGERIDEIKAETSQETALEKEMTQEERLQKKRFVQRKVFQVASTVFIVAGSSLGAVFLNINTVPYFIFYGIVFIFSIFVTTTFFSDTIKEIEGRKAVNRKEENGCSL